MIEHILYIQGGVDQATKPQDSIQFPLGGLFLNILFQVSKPCFIGLPGRQSYYVYRRLSTEAIIYAYFNKKWPMMPTGECYAPSPECSVSCRNEVEIPLVGLRRMERRANGYGESAPRCKKGVRGFSVISSSRLAELAMTPTFAAPNNFAKHGLSGIQGKI